MKDRQGPFSIMRGPADEALIKKAAEIVAQHTKFRGEEFLNILWWRQGTDERQVLQAKAALVKEVEEIRI